MVRNWTSPPIIHQIKNVLWGKGNSLHTDISFIRANNPPDTEFVMVNLIPLLLITNPSGEDPVDCSINLPNSQDRFISNWWIFRLSDSKFTPYSSGFIIPRTHFFPNVYEGITISFQKDSDPTNPKNFNLPISSLERIFFPTTVENLLPTLKFMGQVSEVIQQLYLIHKVGDKK